MEPILINAQVQMWSAKAGMSKSRNALIETCVGKREVKLILYFSTGKIKTLQLHDNIKSVVLQTYGEDQNYLHLTFKNNDFLFVEKLTTTDARRLKRFLDKTSQGSIRPARSDERCGEPSTSAQELNGSGSSCETNSECFESPKESEMCMFRELSLLPSSSTFLHNVGLLENQFIKRKRFFSDLAKNEKQSNLKDSIRDFEANLVVCISNEKGKERNVREVDISKPGFGFPFETNYPEDSGVDVRDLNDLITKLFSPVLLETHCIENGLEWHEYMKTYLLYPEKLWQGLPNVGNTCYINVVLQSLCSIPLFINDLFNQGFPWIKAPKDDFNMLLMQLLVLKDIYNARFRQKLLIGITKALPIFGEIFAVDRQNDAHEFLSLCLVQLKETFQRVTMMWQSENDSGDFYLLKDIFADYATINKMPVCPVTNNFEFELLSSIFCKACGLTLFKGEPSRYLSINIPQGGKDMSIQSTLDLFFSAEELEHRCEKCLYNKSVSFHRFGRLPRVIIVHLKRYHFNESWVMKKDERPILVSKYLRLSCHCSKSTKPPPPLRPGEHVKNLDLLKPLEVLGSEILKLPFNSVRTSRSKGFETINITSNRESEAQSGKRVSEVLSGKVQQENSGKGDTAHIVGSELTKETEKLKKHEEEHRPSDLDSGSIREAQKYQQAEKCNEGRSDKQISLEALTQSRPKPISQEQTENLGKTTLSHTQDSSQSSQSSSDSSKSSRCSDDLDKKAKPTRKVDPTKLNKKEDNVYRLVNIINHIGNSPNGGHYINDAFDFKRQSWFTYSDLHVTRTQEDFVYRGRSSTGYVFFYMHNDIFEELLAKETQSTSTSKG
ncbi:ubiquitin carboxyl-terminal hydrolase 26 isoform X1 [Mus musculus]|jgi:ubiquitin carboxyl-terminal hydrolase 26/29/37|uniref:Ubiquitin carboxyl-terminal hydrolase 26 n=1 Tax=Mus musculus TaxID=10090 RepID=UBP26_MOUSE|nr:ubiquitin carboxyl-terminal hydrolase 26 [Mus musculus]XP_017174134.1 ubiquitin carboxyl-terminal hydrolase 26 isoform X1 [Mus musculus]Q99MX1.2 RecName: Full=Ubiquitin carboxyl-terminal hydrolase 26; AltName: Full=Deubiquitinating enzyme 26; AltName: Full=Ubiquitin thioesterase 26; AltName: Full=Ubiquitin-specific-processing protease 26 [Mus musculus]AAI25455.1 Ubiquitin specific peptidase 26 [Mus musculus]AAI32155.1 Ubiquitin specific peptidase 26 [Mus musculus]|eukprot:NP_113565.2 ubiquitin carboxyl-terminal hydrolase 26 [Mus musculus]